MKLVRDKVPRLFPEHSYRRADQAEVLLLLRLKLAEEIGEVLSAPTQAALAAELADIMDVVCTLAALSGISSGQLASLRREKREERGDLLEGWVLE